jgi:hypothetical protein
MKRDAMEEANLEIIKLKSTYFAALKQQLFLPNWQARKRRSRSRLIGSRAADRDALSVAIQPFEANKLGNGNLCQEARLLAVRGYWLHIWCPHPLWVHFGNWVIQHECQPLFFGIT